MQSPRQIMPHAHCAPAPAGALLPQLLWAVAWVSLSPCTLYCHITDSEHDLPNITPLPSHCLCMLRQCYVLVQLQALELDERGNAAPRKVRQLWIQKIISTGVALLCFDLSGETQLSTPRYGYRWKKNEGLQWCFDDDLNSKYVMMQKSESQSYTRTARS